MTRRTSSALPFVLLVGCFDFTSELYGREGQPCFAEGTCADDLRCGDLGLCIDPCSDNDCAGRGVCRRNNGLAYCECETGYIADDTTCIGPGQLGEVCHQDFTCDGDLFCDVSEVCIACTPDVATKCVASQIHRVDSCGRWREVYEHCGHNGCETSNNVCLRPSFPGTGVIDVGTSLTSMSSARAIDGSLVVVAARREANSVTSQTDIYAWRYTEPGGTSELVSGSATDGGISMTTTESIRPSVAQDAQGTTYVAWLEGAGTNAEGQPTFTIQVRSLFNNAWTPIDCLGAVPGPDGRALIAVADTGVYLARSEFPSRTTIWRWDGASCELVTAPESGWNSTDYVRSMTAAPGSSLWVLGYRDQPLATELYAARFSEGAWREFVFPDARFVEISHAVVAVGSDDEPFIAVLDRGYGSGDLFGFKIEDARWVDLGTSITNSTEQSSTPAIAVDEFGYPLVTWADLVTQRLFMKRWDGRGWTGYGILGPDFSEVATVSNARFVFPTVTPTAFRNCLTWQDNSQINILCQ